MEHAKERIIQCGMVLENRRIAAHTFHLKIQSDDFANMQYVAGYTVDLFLGNPIHDPGCEDRKYSFWNYDPVYHIADLAICTFSNGKGAAWVQTLRAGDRIFFKPPRGKLLADNSASHYLLIGDITSLSHLYEINRALAVSKPIFSFIYAGDEGDLFPDIDKSYPFNHHIINPNDTETVLNKVKHLLPEHNSDTIAYVFGHPEICIALHQYLKSVRNIPVQNLRTKPFWKNAKKIVSGIQPTEY